MKRFVEGESRTQGALLPETLDDFVAEANPVRVIDVRGVCRQFVVLCRELGLFAEAVVAIDGSK